MVASVHLGYPMVALTGNELGFIGAIIGGVSTIAAAVMSNTGAARRQRRELRYQRGGSGAAGFLLALLLVSIGAGLYFTTRPNKAAVIASEPPLVPTNLATIAPAAEPTIAPTAAPTIAPAPTSAPAPAPELPPITGQEAAALVASYLQTGNNEATTDDFTVQRIDGVLKIDDARFRPERSRTARTRDRSRAATGLRWCKASPVPKGRPSHVSRTTTEIARANDDTPGLDSIAPRETADREVVRDYAGRHPGMYATRYLEDLREEWPE
jgi:hypothetical protein